MRVNVAIPEAQVTKPVLDAALESVTRLNEQLLEGGHPTFQAALKKQGIQWKPEPPGQEHFDHAGIVAHRGHGDCDDLAPWEAASLRHTGTDPGAKAVVVRSGPNMWHAIVEHSDGSHSDPSKAAGMGQKRGVHGAVLPLMQPAAVVGGYFEPRPTLALRSFPRGYQARVDVPWYSPGVSGEPTPTDYAMTALHSAPVASQALVGAVCGAIELAAAAGYANPQHLERLAAVADVCNGCDHDELVERYGPQHALAAQQLVGSFFGNVFKAAVSPFKAAANFVQHPSLKNLTNIATDPFRDAAALANPLLKIASPLAKMASPFASMIPGFGPLASSALDVVQHGIPTNFKQFGQMAMRQVPNLIPGGGMLSSIMPGGGLPGMFSSMMPGGGGGGGAPPPQQQRPPQYHPPQQYADPPQYQQHMPPGFPPQGFPGFPGGFRFQ